MVENLHEGDVTCGLVQLPEEGEHRRSHRRSAVGRERDGGIGGRGRGPGAAVAGIRVKARADPGVDVETVEIVQGRIAGEDLVEKSRAGAGEKGKVVSESSRRDAGVTAQSLLAREAIDGGGSGDGVVEQSVDMLHPALTSQYRFDEDDGHLRRGKVRLDPIYVVEGILQYALLDVAADLRPRVLRCGQVETRGTMGQEGDQLLVVAQRIAHAIVGDGQRQDFGAGIVPVGQIAAVAWLFVDETLPRIIEGRVDVGESIQQHAGASGVLEVTGGGEGLGEALDTRPHQSLPLPVDEPGGDEAPTVAVVVDETVAVIDAESVEGIVGVGMIGVEQEAAIGVSRIEDAGHIETGTVEGMEIVLRKDVAAARAGQFPRPLEGSHHPVVHVDLVTTRRARPIRPHHPRTRQGVAEDEIPQRIDRQGAPRGGALLGEPAQSVIPVELFEHMSGVKHGDADLREKDTVSGVDDVPQADCQAHTTNGCSPDPCPLDTPLAAGLGGDVTGQRDQHRRGCRVVGSPFEQECSQRRQGLRLPGVDGESGQVGPMGAQGLQSGVAIRALCRGGHQDDGQQDVAIQLVAQLPGVEVRAYCDFGMLDVGCFHECPCPLFVTPLQWSTRELYTPLAFRTEHGRHRTGDRLHTSRFQFIEDDLRAGHRIVGHIDDEGEGVGNRQKVQQGPTRALAGGQSGHDGVCVDQLQSAALTGEHAGHRVWRGEWIVGNDGCRPGEGPNEGRLAGVRGAGEDDRGFALPFDVEGVVLSGSRTYCVVSLEAAHLPAQAVP